VFHPLKAKYHEALQQFKLEKGLRMGLDDLPSILQNAWTSTVTQSNIKAGFKKCGIWPINIKWVEENAQVFISTSISNEDRFHVLRQRSRGLYENDGDLLRSCDYLDLAVNTLSPKKEKHCLLEGILNVVYSSALFHANDSFREPPTRRKNIVGESTADAKILNNVERINKLH
jgi:hypothetical protein